MGEDRNSYKSITKSIGIFGGTKIFQIIIGIVKNKIVAVLLGPIGMGIQGMLTTTTTMVTSLTNLGLSTSAVRDVAKASVSRDKDVLNRTVTILRKLVLLTGLLGTLLVFFFAPLLSQWSFGNDDYTTAFRIISVCLLFDQIVVGQVVLMQGTFHYRYMAMASLWGSIVSLVVCVPLYYFFGFDGIVPVIIANSAANLLISSYYSHKVPYQRQKLTWEQVWSGGKAMIALGLAVAMAGAVNTGQIYLVRSYITKFGSLEAVGLYTAGANFVIQYVNVLFQSMGSDYQPRLAAVSDDNKTFIEVINRQAVMLVTFMAPIAMIFTLFARELILILYSSKFLPIIGMIEWMMAGMLFRAISWSMSYAFAAKGESRAFFVNELIASAYSLVFTILGFKLYSYTGIGIGFFLIYICYTVQCYVISRVRYGFRFNKEVFKKCFPLTGLTFAFILLLKLITVPWMKFVVGIVFSIIICIISYRWLDEMIDVKETLLALKNKILPSKK